MTWIIYIQSHPKIALIVGGIHLFMAEYLNNVQIPEIVMQAFQIGAWTITMAVGLITIHGSWKKRRKK